MADLAVHHPARGDDVGAGARLGQRRLGVDLERARRCRRRRARRARRSGRGRCTRRRTGRRSARCRRRGRRAGRRAPAARCRRGRRRRCRRRPCAPARRTARRRARRAAASSATSLRRLSRVCWTTPGSDTIGCGSVMPSRTNSGAMRSLVRTVVSATRSRRAGVRRRRRGRSTGKGAAGIAVMVRRRSSRSDTVVSVGRRRHVVDAHAPRRSPRAAVTGPRATTTARGGGADGVGPAAAAEPLASTTASTLAQPGDLVGVRRPADRAVRRHGLDRVAHRGEPVGEHRRGPGRPGRAARAPAARGNSASSPSAWASAGTRSTARPAAAASAAAVAGPTAARRTAGWSAAAGPARRAPLADVTTSQSNAPSRASALAQRGAAVERLGDLDQRDVHDRRAERGEPRARARRRRAG